MLIGRTRELERLERALDACDGGRGVMLAVCGAAGIGKTRLADELADRAARQRGFAVAWGRAWETEGAPAYWPWTECLTAVAEGLDGQPALPPAVQRLLDAQSSRAGSDGLRADPERERFELFEGVATYLRAAAKHGPLLLVLDDLHAADIASLELLARVARGLRTARVAVLGTYRDAEARRAPVADVIARIAREAEVLPLEPLPREDVAEIVRHELGGFDATLAKRVFDLTDGNPLFVRETVHAVALSRHGGRSGDPIEALALERAGGGIAALVRSRLSGASEPTVALLETGAVLGREIDPALLSAASGAPMDEVMRALHEGAERGLLITRGRTPARWFFAHVLLREPLYRELSPERRRALHQVVAGALEERVARGREEDLATLAHHAIEALPTGDVSDVARAMDAARRAAERARAQLAHDEAIALLERALRAYDMHAGANAALDEQHAAVSLALGWATTEAGQLDRGRAVFRRLAASARARGDARLLARAALGQGGAYVLAEIRSELVDTLREALALLDGRDELEDRRLEARVLARLAGALTPSAHPEEPLGMARRALAMTRDETDTRTRIDVDLGAGSALIDFAMPAERIACDERLLRDARQIGDRVLELRALTRLSCAHLENGDPVSAAVAIDARAALGDALESARHRWPTPLLRSMHAMQQGRFDDCEALVAEARAAAIDASGEDPNAVRCIAIHRFCLSIHSGRHDDLHERMVAALVAVEPFRDRAINAWITASGAAALGDSARAVAALRTIVYTECASKARCLRTMSANAAALCGAHEEAAALYDWLSAHQGGFSCWGPFGFAFGPPVAQALAAAAFTCGRREDGIRHAQEALALCQRTGALGPEAWVHLIWGEGVADRGHLERALAIADQLGMPAVAERAQRALERAAGEAPEATPAAAQEVVSFTLVRKGKDWTVTRDGRSFPLKNVRGLAMLARLVDNPGCEIHALDLAGDPGAAGAVVDLGDAGEVIDARARDAYKARITELLSEIEEADSFADLGRAERARRELDALQQQLAEAVGLGGRQRRSGSAAERARITVQRRVREAIKRIFEHDAELGRHLDWAIRTGTFCAYEPEGRMAKR